MYNNEINYKSVLEEYKLSAEHEFEAMNYSNALDYYSKILNLQKQTLSKDSKEIGETYLCMAKVCKHISDYFRAIYYLLNSLNILEKDAAADKEKIAQGYYEVSAMYYDIGMHSKAEECSRKTIDMYVDLEYDYHKNIVALYNILGMIFLARKDYKNAIDYCLLSLNNEKIQPLDEAAVYHNLGLIYDAQGDYGKAYKFYEKAMHIYEEYLAFEDINNAMINMLLFICADNLERTTEAERFRAAAMHYLVNLSPADQLKRDYVAIDYQSYRHKYMHYQNEYMLQSAVMHAESRIMMKQVEQGYFLSLNIPDKHIRSTYLDLYDRCFDLCFSFFVTCPRDFSRVDMYSLYLKTRKLSAEVNFVQSYFMHHTIDNKDKMLLEKLRNLYTEWSRLWVSAETTQGISEIEEEIHSTEVLLSEYLYQQKSVKNIIRSVDAVAVADALPRKHAVIEYIKYYFTKSDDDKFFDGDSGYYYFAFFVVDGYLQCERIGACDTIDSLIQSLNSEAGQRDGNMDFIEYISGQLFDVLLKPVAARFEDIEHLYVAPDAELYYLPFELLHRAKQIARPTISYISTGRDLIGGHAKDKAEYRNAVLLCDPAFYLNSHAVKSGRERGMGEVSVFEKELDELYYAERYSRGVRQVLEPRNFHRLPFTKIEAEFIAEELGKCSISSSLLDGEKVTKQEVQKLKSPSILHIATHGFALEHDRQESEIDIRQSRRGIRQNIEEPLLRCGLLLSGACNWLENEEIEEKYGDGILNGNDVMSLDLGDTELVVLSACRTGIGEANKGEGIQGLRKAFMLAGASSLVSTLWEVNDISGAILMSAFYRNLLECNMSKINALVAAKNYIRELTSEKLIKEGWREVADRLSETGNIKAASALKYYMFHVPANIRLFEHPYYWAGHILQGDID